MTKAELTVIVSTMKAWVESRLSQVETRSGPAGERGERGEPGRSADPVDAEALIAEILRRMPVPVNGVDGKDGKDGRDGIDGKDGAMGPQGERGMDGESLQGPAGPQGERGLPGESIQGPKGDIGERGLDGKDAILPDLEPIVHRAFDVWFSKYGIEVERRAHDMFQRAIDQMPTPKDGRDAFELEDLTVTDDGHGNVTLTFIRGEFRREFTLRFPCFEDRGVFSDGERYLSGHGVSYGGSFWIAAKDDAQGKPGDRNSDWRLAVKKGRDGKDGVKPPPEGPVKL
jgi:hypothetical protein